MYGENKSLIYAFTVGAISGAAGTTAGELAGSWATAVMPKYVGGVQINPRVPLLLQNYGQLNPYPSVVGQVVDQAVSGVTPIIADQVTKSHDGSQP